MNKKGVSPIIATVLLITLVIILITLIMVWVKGFVNERISKEGALSDAELKCTQINLELKNIRGIVSDTGKLQLIVEVVNTGSEDLAAVAIRLENNGITDVKTLEERIKPFETLSKTFDSDLSIPGTKVTLIPHVRPEGIGAPLVPCSGDKIKKVTLK